MKVQRDDYSLKNYLDREGAIIKVEKEVTFDIKHGIVYNRIYKQPM